jgi:hypothetical protein
MAEFEKSSVIKASPERLFEFLLNMENMAKISPPDTEILELNAPNPITANAEFDLRLKRGPFRLSWRGRVLTLEPPRLMVDEQVRGPFRRFQHTHQFREIGAHTLVIDRIEYEPFLGPLGAPLDVLFIRPLLKRMFDYRHRRLKELFESGS